VRRAIGVAALATMLGILSPPAAARVLRVGTYRGISGQYKSIQAAVDAARPGDWILVGPGDYKTISSRAPKGASDTPAAVLITTPHIHLRGMNRNRVVVDGTKPGTPRCAAAGAAQNFGPSQSGKPQGLNGVVIWKADNVSVQNLTACNFLGGAGSAGNEIWWNGGDGSGAIHGHGFTGSFLTATSTYYHDEATAAQYGIFSSNWSAGTWYRDYTSNFNDSGFYIGACQQVCDQTMNQVWSEYNALGYSGTNSGGRVLIEHSQFDNNKDGFDTNSQNNDDFPSPQNGACPHNGISPITHTHSCWVFMDNYVHDNNNPYVPAAGAAAGGPVGTGMSVSGGRNDTIMHNRFVHNGAWGTIFVPYPDTETPPPDAPNCRGGTSAAYGGVMFPCVYDDWGNRLIGNTYARNGFFGNPSNGDFAETTVTPGHPMNCYRANTDTSGPVTSSPPALQNTNSECGQPAAAPDLNPVFTAEVICDSQIFGSMTPCPPGAKYPRSGGKVVMHALPRTLHTMPNPCAGVPVNPWCPRRGSSGGSGGPPFAG
jgi:hypothetical protein